MWLFQNTTFGCFLYLLVSGWRRATSSWPHWKTSSLIKAEWWVPPEKCNLKYEITPLLLGFFSVALQHDLNFVQLIKLLLQNMLIMWHPFDILNCENITIDIYKFTSVYIIECRYCVIISMKAKTFLQLFQGVDILPLAMELFAVPTCNL